MSENCIVNIVIFEHIMTNFMNTNLNARLNVELNTLEKRKKRNGKGRPIAL